MSALYSHNNDTLTTQNILDSYISAFHSAHDTKPVCSLADAGRFMIDGVVRDRRWMMLEVERLRQEALTNALDNRNMNRPTGTLFKLIRRLSKL